jgi:hypothetical protein
MASVAELEAGMNLGRPKAALAAAKARGKQLGGERNLNIAEEVRLWGRSAILKRANAKAADYAPVIREIQAAGVTSMAGIAEALNTRGIPTALAVDLGTTCCSHAFHFWSAAQFSRLAKELKNDDQDRAGGCDCRSPDLFRAGPANDGCRPCGAGGHLEVPAAGSLNCDELVQAERL